MICMISHSVETPRGTGAFFFNTLRLRHPMRAGIFSVLLFSSQPLRLFNPLALRALPLYFAAQNTPQCYGTRQGRSVIPGLLLSLFFNPSVLRTPPLYFAVQNTEEEGILDSVAVAVF